GVLLFNFFFTTPKFSLMAYDKGYPVTFQNFINISRGTTINGITKQNLKDCKICVPPLSEQNLIVAEIDRRFAIVDKTLNLIDKSIQNAKNLKQSILKKAFSGELRSEI
ncbi:MAG: restriction endonuclease subunit S, partial [Campylobacter sp.]|nr:restriction endonuclease subunit S [Campylobacter sp.]